MNAEGYCAGMAALDCAAALCFSSVSGGRSARVDHPAVGKRNARQAPERDEIVECVLNVVERLGMVLADNPPAANTLGRIGGPRMVIHIAFDDARDHDNPLAVDCHRWDSVGNIQAC